MKMKKINLEELGRPMSRSEMKEVMAGSGGGGAFYIECCNCNNDSCRGYASDCLSGVYQICGPGRAGELPCYERCDAIV